MLKTACGSPCYAAPEMIAGKKYKGIKVDLWSSGVILFALLCGYLPFDDSKTQKLYYKIMKGEYKIPHEFVSPLARDLIKRILTTDPNKRITIPEIRKHPWFHIYKKYIPKKKGIVVGYHEIPIDPDVIQSVVDLGYEE